MLCQTCSLKNECERVCKDVESYLKSKRNYKTTYVNKEIGISAVSEKAASLDSWVNSESESHNEFHETWMAVVKVAETKLTAKQHQVFWMYLEGMAMAEIGRQLGTSGQAINYAIFGHPVQGGGIVRKMQKLLAKN